MSIIICMLFFSNIIDLLVGNRSAALKDIIVNVEEGALRGFTAQNRKGGQFYKFLGIPYAKPPLGNLRFKSPLLPDSWKGVRDATREGDECYAAHIDYNVRTNVRTEQSGSEDCLVLNVFTPEFQLKNCTNLKPVMIFIHGGGFIRGSNTQRFYGAEYLLTEDIVLVAINYRVGASGFLSIGNSSLGVTGNAGLKDALASLKWVQRNIKQFCGNPNNVTIFGESAGGAIVHHLILSPSAKGLFQKAISQSGVSMNTWAICRRDAYKDLARALGCTKNQDWEILKFLQSVSITVLIAGQRKLRDTFSPSMMRPFCPVIEDPSPEAFITENPMKIIESGNYNQVPMIIGHNSAEGLYFQLLKGVGAKIDVGKEVVPFLLGLKEGSKEYEEIADQIREFYFGDKEPVPESQAWVDLASDNVFIREINRAAMAHLKAQNAPVYYYDFSIDSKLNGLKTIIKVTASRTTPDIPGACHGDDIMYLFKQDPPTEITEGSIEDISIEKMVKLWTNFAKTGNPIDTNQEVLKDVHWEPLEKNKFNYLEIGPVLISRVDAYKDRMSFWENIFRIAKKI